MAWKLRMSVQFTAAARSILPVKGTAPESAVPSEHIAVQRRPVGKLPTCKLPADAVLARDAGSIARSRRARKPPRPRRLPPVCSEGAILRCGAVVLIVLVLLEWCTKVVLMVGGSEGAGGSGGGAW